MWNSLILHEAAHAITAKLVGAKIVEIKPWPHRYRGFWSIGKIRCRGLKRDRPFFYVAPLAKVAILYLLWLILGLFVWAPLLILIVPEVIDSAVWFRSYFRGPEEFDGAKFRLYTNR